MTVTGLADVPACDWNLLEGASRNAGRATYNPFIFHAYLSALEDSGCVAPETGWAPRHMVLRDGSGKLAGALPGYIKSHSMGEYVFDQGWADAFERAGGRYYPKFQCSIPFTPATGPRLLSVGGVGRDAIQKALAAGAKTLCEHFELSSAHATFVPEDEVQTFLDAGYLHRTDQQFHFRNENYSSYEDFLTSLSSRKRKMLRKERSTALENDISVEWLTGHDLTEGAWDAFHAFYMDTGGRKWGRPYLNRRFFSLIGERMAEDVLLIMVRRQGRYIAGAINFIGGDCLYGRHWGCIEDHPFLHFEVCYHQAIDFAIAHGLARVEAGTQGEHKLARGYLPVTTHSVHYISHQGLRRAVADYLEMERRDVAEIGNVLSKHGPFRKDGTLSGESR